MMKAFLSALAILSLAGCQLDASNEDAAKKDVVIQEVTVGPEKVPCVGVGPMICLVVDGKLFYSPIFGFEHKAGTIYRLKIERKQRFTPENAPADANLYEYHLIEILSQSPA